MPPAGAPAPAARRAAAETCLLAGRAAEAQGRHEAALDAYGLAVRLDPGGFEQRLALARWCGGTGAFAAGTELLAGFEHPEALRWRHYFAYRLEREPASRRRG